MEPSGDYCMATVNRRKVVCRNPSRETYQSYPDAVDRGKSLIVGKKAGTRHRENPLPAARFQGFGGGEYTMNCSFMSISDFGVAGCDLDSQLSVVGTCALDVCGLLTAVCDDPTD